MIATIAMRISNKEDGSLILTRLSHGAIDRLAEWFQLRGHASGHWLQLDAPILEFVLKRSLRPRDDSDSRSSRREAARTAFGFGITLGSKLLADASEGPFPADLDLESSLPRLGALEPFVLDPASADQRVFGAREARSVTTSLIEIAPVIADALRASWRRGRRIEEDHRFVGPRSNSWTPSRFVFFCGLMAAGLAIPSGMVSPRSPGIGARELDIDDIPL